MRKTTDGPILQAREMDPDVYRFMRIECASEQIKLAELIKLMCDAYRRLKSGELVASDGH